MSIIYELKVGTPVEISYLNAMHERVSLKVGYIGSVSSEFMLFDLTRNKKSLHEIKMLRPGLALELKSIVSDATLTSINFQSELLMLTTVQVPVLVVTFPKDINQKRLRCEPRLKIELMVKLTLESSQSEHLAMVTDMSKSGVHCEYHPTDQELAEADSDSLNALIDETVKIEFPPDEENPEAIVIRGKVKNIRGRDKLSVGIQFDSKDIGQIQMLYVLLVMREHGL
ncbi:PilZ domain-containing protein [Alteromonas gracilis]|uniref:PilZ domain-containing protein n=1 Tax=Alteromonas gracilis TaxID=1479524 RepID=UPI0037353C95